MTEVLTIFGVVGAIIAVGFLANVFFKKTGFPDTLFLILIGIILGPLFGVFLREEMLPVTPFLTTLTLMMIASARRHYTKKGVAAMCYS